VELEVEEDGVAAVEQGFKDGGTGGGEELQTYLEPVAGAFELVDQGGGGGGIGYVEGYDQALARLVKRVRLTGGCEGWI
jgi:hypothetical protein